MSLPSAFPAKLSRLRRAGASAIYVKGAAKKQTARIAARRIALVLSGYQPAAVTARCAITLIRLAR
jgi:hypothetical protein